MLVLMGIAYSIVNNNISSMMVYFFVQSLASFLILISYLFSVDLLFSFALVLKLGMFPFIFWYLSSVSYFPGSLFFFASTFHKLPPLILLFQFSIHIIDSVF